MGATIHSLIPNHAAPKAAPHPLVVELRDSSLQILDELVRRMFDSADDSLFEMGEKAANDSERRRYFDTMRVLRIDRSRVTVQFSEHLARGFSSGAVKPQQNDGFDLDSLSIQPTEELEEKIALSNMATKAEDLYKNLIWDLERRLEIAELRGVPVSPQALSPARICEAFGMATAVLDTDFQVKLVVFKLFDRVLSRELDRVYKSALKLLDRHGVDTSRASVAPVVVRPFNNQSGTAQNVGSASASNSALVDQLRQLGFDPDRLRGTGAPAAQQLAEALQVLLNRGGTEGIQASTQRLSMASEMFDDMLREPLLPEALRPALELLRYPLYRTALADPSFFTSPAHPLRKMLGELIELAAATHTGDTSATRFRSVLDAAIGQANSIVAPQLGAPARTTALSTIELEAFLQQLREQAQARRAALLLHVRRQVAQELEQRTFGRSVPKPALNLLRSGIGPLMAVRMVKNGRGSAQFREAEGLLERVLTSLEFTPPPQEAVLQSREKLLTEVVDSLKEIGMGADKIEPLLDGLKQVHAKLDQPLPSTDAAGQALTANEQAQLLSDFAPEVAAAAPKPAPAAEADDLPKITALELLSRVLTPESWFRVYDAAQNQTRWLKLASFYANQDSVTFAGFDETTRLSLRASRLAEDLVQGHSEPINPNPSAREALEQLRQAKARGLL